MLKKLGPNIRGSLGTPGMNQNLPDHLEDIVMGSHPSLGRRVGRHILHQYARVSGTRLAGDRTDYVSTA